MRRMDIKNAFLQAAGFERYVRLRVPVEWDPRGAERIWKLRAPDDGLNDALVALREPRRDVYCGMLNR